MSLHDSKLQLNALLLEDVFESSRSLGARVRWHYSMQLLQCAHTLRLAPNTSRTLHLAPCASHFAPATLHTLHLAPRASHVAPRRCVYRLINSHDLLGIPSRFFSDVGGGVRQLYYEPRNGLVRAVDARSPAAFARGLAGGARGLAGGVLGGTAAGAAGLVSAVTSAASHAAGALSFDKDYTYRRQVLMQQQAASTTSGVRQGLQAVSLGLRAAASGVIHEPVRGAIDGGTKGFIKGVGRGLVGVVAKPTSGLAALVAKATEGLASDAKRVTVRGKEAKGSHELRVRQPRELGPVLLPYPGAPSLKF